MSASFRYRLKGLRLLIFKSISSDKWEPSHLWPPWVSRVPGPERVRLAAALPNWPLPAVEF